MISSFLNIFKQIKLKVTSYLQDIIAQHKEVRRYINSILYTAIRWRNFFFLYSLTPSVLNYLLTTYCGITEIYPIFYLTGTLSFLLSCMLTYVIQKRWYNMVKKFEASIKQAIEVAKLKEAYKHITKWPESTTIPFAYSRKTIIIIFEEIATILTVDYISFCNNGFSLILRIYQLNFC